MNQITAANALLLRVYQEHVANMNACMFSKQRSLQILCKEIGTDFVSWSSFNFQ
jgi:hypothetical protein